jgi:hypothetical protein
MTLGPWGKQGYDSEANTLVKRRVKRRGMGLHPFPGC